MPREQPHQGRPPGPSAGAGAHAGLRSAADVPAWPGPRDGWVGVCQLSRRRAVLASNLPSVGCHGRHDRNLNAFRGRAPPLDYRDSAQVPAPAADRRRRPLRRMTRARLRGLLRLAVLVGLVGWLVVLAAKAVFGGSSSGSSVTSTEPATSRPIRAEASTSPL